MTQLCPHCGFQLVILPKCAEHNWTPWTFLKTTQLWARTCKRCSIWETQEEDPEVTG